MKLKTTHIDEMAKDLHVAYAGGLTNKKKSFSRRLWEAERKREMVLRGLRDGLGKRDISKRYGIALTAVQYAYTVLRNEGKLWWDESKGSNGGWRVRDGATGDSV